MTEYTCETVTHLSTPFQIYFPFDFFISWKNLRCYIFWRKPTLLWFQGGLLNLIVIAIKYILLMITFYTVFCKKEFLSEYTFLLYVCTMLQIVRSKLNSMRHIRINTKIKQRTALEIPNLPNIICSKMPQLYIEFNCHNTKQSLHFFEIPWIKYILVVSDHLISYYLNFTPWGVRPY